MDINNNIEIVGEVARIRFYKDMWGIIEVEVQETLKGEPRTDRDGCLICKGNMPEVRIGNSYIIHGTFVQDPKWGDQYNITKMYTAFNADTADDNSKRRFLMSIFTPKQVEAMYSALKDPFAVLQAEDTKQLMKINGVRISKATDYIQRFKANVDFGRIFTELPEYDLTNKMIAKLMKEYHSPDIIVQKIKENPYILADEVNGIGWATADRIATAGGIQLDDPRRIAAYILRYLRQSGESGRSWITTDELLGAVLDELGEDIPDAKITDAIHLCQDELWWNEDKTQIGLQYYYYIENRIAEELIRIRNAEPIIKDYHWKHWRDAITKIEKQQGWKYTEEQIAGIQTALSQNITLITGMAGSGKSSLVSGILAVLDKWSYVQCALSGRAASRLSEITGQKGYTIHRLLGYPDKTEKAKNEFHFHDDNPLSYDIYILDEISMVNAALFYFLLRAIPSGAKLICLGDYGQLEAIGSGNIAFDMMHSPEISTVLLTKIQRQAEASGIISEAFKVRRGNQIVDKDWAGQSVKGELQDLYIVGSSDGANIFYGVMKRYTELYHQPSFDISQVQVLAPMKNRGNDSTYVLNNALQELVNAADPKKKEVTIYTDGNPVILREGDKVINTKNNYETKPVIYNGNMGIINKIEGDLITIEFFGIGLVEIERKGWNTLDLGYAITVHKAQGSEWDHVIIAIDSNAHALLTRELIYTAITRAKKHCDLIVQTSALRYATMNENVSQKQTHLQKLLHDIAHPALVF